MNATEQLAQAIAGVPPGRWAIGVSGGADSVALLRLLAERDDVTLHVAHLDHQTRGRESEEDAAFVKSLARELRLPSTIATRDEVEPMLHERPANRSALFRRLRLRLFRDVVERQDLLGVIVAHHADDVVETTMLRLLRGSGVEGLAGLQADRRVAGVRVLRPLLAVRRDTLRQWLRANGFAWREDASNRSPAYRRTRVRELLAKHPEFGDELIRVANAAADLKAWVETTAPTLDETFEVAALADLPPLLARRSAKRWLVARGVPPARVEPHHLEQLVEMASDAASASIVDFPAGTRVRRRRGRIAAVR